MFRRNDQPSTRDLLRFPALLVIALVEAQMNTGALRVLYPLLGLSLLSPFAQKLWAAILMARVLLMSWVDWQPLNQFMSADFFIIRTLFVWIMLVQNRLVGANRAVQLLRKALLPHIAVTRGFLVAAVVAIVLWVIFFDIQQPYVNLLFAGFLVYVVRLLPKATSRQRVISSPADIGLAVASTLVCLVLFELGVRFILHPAPAVQGGIHKPHPRALFILAKNTRFDHATEEFSCSYVISDQGFRDRHYSKKDGSTYRILCVGDSFTIGHGVSQDEPYPKVLEALLAGYNLNRRVEVINGANGAYGVWQQIILLEERGFAVEPDLVILQLFPHNDVRDALARVGKVLETYNFSWQKYLQYHRTYYGSSVTKVLCTNSRAFAFVHDRYVPLRQRLLPHLRPRFRKPAHSLPPPRMDRPIGLETMLKTYYAELEEGWKLMESSLQEVAKICHERGVALLAFAIPSLPEIDTGLFLKATRGSHMNPGLYDAHKPTRLAEEMCGRNGVEFVDIVPGVTKAFEEGAHLYYKVDEHWTATAHRVCAQILCEHLVKTHLREMVPASDDRTDG